MGGTSSKDRGHWDLEAIADHTASINVMTVSEDESVLVTGSDDGTARVYNVAGSGKSADTTSDCQCMGVLRGHTSYITALGSVAEFVVTGSADTTVRKWDMVSCRCLYVYQGHTARITRLICSLDFIVTASYDRTCRLWKFDMDSDEDSEEDSDEDDEDEDSDDSHRANRSKSAKTSPACLRTFVGHTSGVYPICFIPGDLVAEAQTRSKQEHTDKNSDTKNAQSLNNNDDDDEEKEEFGDNANIESATVTEVGAPPPEQFTIKNGIHPLDVLISGSADGTARCWSLAKGIAQRTLKGHRGAISCLAVDDSGTILFTGSTDRTVRQWDIASGTCTRLLDEHKEAVVCLQLVNQMLYTGSADTTARCFVTDFGDCARIYRSQRDTVICLRFSEGLLMTGSGDTVARVYDARSGRLRRVYAGHRGAINCMTLIKRRLYTGSSDGVLRVWDADVTLDDVAETVGMLAPTAGSRVAAPEPVAQIDQEAPWSPDMDMEVGE